MKNFFLLLFACFISLEMNAQDLSDKSVALIALNVTIYSDVMNKLDTYTPSTSREKKQFAESTKLLNQHINDFIFDEVSAQLEKEKGITGMGKNDVFDGKVIYNAYGYPFPFSAKGGVKKARKNGNTSDAYLKINMTISAAMDILGGAKLAKQYKPELSANISILGIDGKEMMGGKGKYKAEEHIKAKNFSGKKFDKLDHEYVELLVAELKPMISKAINLAIEKI